MFQLCVLTFEKKQALKGRNLSKQDHTLSGLMMRIEFTKTQGSTLRLLSPPFQGFQIHE